MSTIKKVNAVSYDGPMRVVNGALKGMLGNNYSTTTVGEGANGAALIDGEYMFMSYASLTSFSIDLPNLENGTSMFSTCYNLASFTGDLSKLQNGTNMFDNCSNLTSFSTDLPNLENGNYMFANCFNLTSFSTDLPKLVHGTNMFNGCNRLTSFTGDLSNLTDGTSMFFYCELDVQSIVNVLSSIPFHSSGTHILHMGFNTNFQNDPDGIIRQWLKNSDGTEVSIPIAAGAYRCYGTDPNDGVFKNKGWLISISAL